MIAPLDVFSKALPRPESFSAPASPSSVRESTFAATLNENRPEIFAFKAPVTTLTLAALPHAVSSICI